MTKVEIHYSLSQAGRKVSLLAGGNGKEHQCVVLQHDQPGFAEALGLATVDREGRATVLAHTSLCGRDIGEDYYGPNDPAKDYDAPAEAGTLIADECQRRAAFRARIAAERRAAEEQEKQRYEEQVADYLGSGPASLIRYWEITNSKAAHDPRLAGLRAEAEKLIATHKAEEAAAEQAKKEAAQRAADECTEWIKAYGSSRLQRMLREGIELDRAYRDERLAAERPGWVWYQEAPGTYDEPRNPPEKAFELLDQARTVDPSARLAFWTDKHECDDDCDVDCDKKYDFRGYAAVADFLDAEIVFGLPQAQPVKS
jgi:hypothetical protein